MLSVQLVRRFGQFGDVGLFEEFYVGRVHLLVLIVGRARRPIRAVVIFAMNRSSFRLPTATIPNPNTLRQPADL